MLLAQGGHVSGAAAVTGIVVFALSVITFGAIASTIWKNKGGSPGIGFLIGGLLGLIGLLIVALAKPSRPAPRNPAEQMRECPHCREPMRRNAGFCQHCRQESDRWTLHDGRWWYQSKDDGEWYYLDELRNEWIKFSAPAPSA